ncbi:MAG TPA: FAD-dependent oxidoreductase, partial [Chitinophagales bacterium]|nr:FAD-dependent oxidoreductase [Chitinophagales bacterium]
MIRQRQHNIELIAQQDFDLVVIGGGITGAGIALAASRQAWKVLIIDKGDFSSGTSSKSAKMVHGGLRYLENLEFKLVGEALHEREHLLKEYPHLVHPQPFFMPIYNSRIELMKLRLGLTSYDLLTGTSSLPKFRQVSKKEIKQLYPEIKTDKIVGGFIYYDAKTNDSRLTNEVIQQAVELGAVAMNYYELTDIHISNSSVDYITCVDQLTGDTHIVKSKLFVSATGIWTGDVLRKLDASDKKKYMMPSKGIHIAVSADLLPKDVVWVLPSSSKDGRRIWCMPWENNINIIGSTDTDYRADKDNIPVLR